MMRIKRSDFFYIALLMAAFAVAMMFAKPEASTASNKVLNAQESFFKKRLQSNSTNPYSQSPKIYFLPAISSFYEKRNYNTLWVMRNGLTPEAQKLILNLEEADSEGLIPEDYHLNQIKELQALLQKKPLNNEIIAELELLLTDALLLFSSHLISGRVKPAFVDPDWFFLNHENNNSLILEAASSNQIDSFFKMIRPSHKFYYRLMDALKLYISIRKQGGWSVVPSGPALRMGDKDERVEWIRKRLSITGETGNPGFSVPLDSFDESLSEGVRKFQKRHGLETDGVVGAKTLAAMNVSVEDRIRQIEINLERWRWIPRDLGVRYILVNIADYSLAVVENQEIVLEMKVVVGKAYRQTPVFSEKMRYLVLNPFWSIPLKIAVEDKLPIIINDPDYLTKQGIKVLDGWSENAQEINPAVINWKKMNMNYFPYNLRQDPGPMNALGKIKFMFPNKFFIYLHDTPQRGLFRRAARDFSSGCIRIEKPFELAVYLLKNDPQWPPEAIKEAMGKGVQKVIRLKDFIPVHLLYWTAWVNDHGVVHFGNDIYNRDPSLSRAIKSRITST